MPKFGKRSRERLEGVDPQIIKLLDEIVESDWCKRQGMNRSELVRHLVRVGIKNFQSNQPKERAFKR